MNAQYVKALIESHSDGDDSRFYTVALQIAAQEARQGHAKFAKELRELIDEAQKKSSLPSRSKPIPIVQPQGELAGLLSASYPKLRISDMVLDHLIHDKLVRILTEQRQRDRIREHGYEPHRKLLLIGPPGTGKTMTAGMLAGELGLALFTIQLDGLITKFLGETAAKLRLIFDAIQQTRAVYLFDEFDALGSDRSTRNDVGEIRRVLNSFLQFLEQDESDSLIVAATNHPGILDKALFRRFDIVVCYTLPNSEIVEHVLKNRLGLLDIFGINWKKVSEAAKGLSHGDIARACEQAAKKAILDEKTKVSTEDLVAALTERRSVQS
jgi:SpoVK/Ycf46/Vps4 family AAA+-type ATPase